MSIYATWLSIDDQDHDPECAKWELIGEVAEGWPDGAAMLASAEDGRRRFYRRTDKACTCGNPAPIIYQGSHVNPSDDGPRGGSVDVAAIPNHCHPNVRMSGEDDMRFPVEYLRLSVAEDPATYHYGQAGYAQVVLDRRQVERIRDTLNQWLETKERW